MVTGRSGTDGNTILTVAGAPDTTLGKDGDYAINTTVWEIYGPRSGGVWGAGTPLRGNTRAGGETGVPLFASHLATPAEVAAGLTPPATCPCPARASLRTFARRVPESALPAKHSGATISLIRATSTVGSLTRCFIRRSHPGRGCQHVACQGDYEGQLIFMSGGLYHGPRTLEARRRFAVKHHGHRAGSQG